jgi:hypothetical protein
MRTVADIASELADAARELQGQREYHAQLLEQAAQVDERIGIARDRCAALRLELGTALEGSIGPAR